MPVKTRTRLVSCATAIVVAGAAFGITTPAYAADTTTQSSVVADLGKVWQSAPKNATIAEQATVRGKTIHDLAPYGGQLYAGYGDYDNGTASVQVTSYNPTTKTWTNHLEAGSEELNTFKVINGKLYAPQVDPLVGVNENAGYVTDASGEWKAVAGVPFINIFDMASTDGNDIWLAGQVADEGGQVAGAAIKRSVDGGATWTTELQVSSDPSFSFDRFYWMASVDGKVIARDATMSSQVHVWEAGSWTHHDLAYSTPSYNDANVVAAFKGELHFAYGKLNVSSLETVNTTNPAGVPRDYFVDEATQSLYAVGEFGVSVTTDGINWTLVNASVPVNAHSVAVLDGLLYVGDNNATLHVFDVPPPVVVEPEPEPEPEPQPEPEPVKKNHAPILTAGTANIAKGATWDALEGVKAKDKEDGELVIQVISNTVDSSKPGTYTVLYKVVDSAGAVVELDRKVHVKKK